MRDGHRRRWWVHLPWAMVLMATGGPTALPAQAGGERILTVATDALYGGATGLLLGGVLTLVVPAEKRADMVRWGVVLGTFAGFGYGLYEARGPKDGFSERVQARADARFQARLAAAEDVGFASMRGSATPGGSSRTRGVAAVRFWKNPHCRKIEERPEPTTGRATGRTSW